MKKLILTLLLLFIANAAYAKTLYQKDAEGNIVYRAECENRRCEYFDKNGTYIGHKEPSGDVINVYDRHGVFVRTETVGGL